MDIAANKFDVTVIFDPNKTGTDPFSYEVDGVHYDDSFAITVNKELGLVLFRLYTPGNGENAVFATSPMQWLSSSLTPIPMPSGVSVSRDAEDGVTLVDVNSVAVGQADLSFEINVMYKGKTYTSQDPTIINTPITGGPEIAAETHATAELLVS